MIISDEDLKKARILIVDDQAANVLLLQQFLKQRGFTQVKSTEDSRQAAALYREFDPDLVLLDLNMPHLDGFAVMQQLREIEKDNYVPVMVLTAQTDQENRLKALEAGAKDFLSKPLDFAEVSLRIRNILEIRLLNNLLSESRQFFEIKARERAVELISKDEALNEEISSRMLAERENKGLAEQLEMKNQELNDFFYAACHDLKEPLRKIVSFGGMLQSALNGAEGKEAGYLDRLDHSVGRMQSLIDDLILFYEFHRKKSAFRSLDLNPLVEALIAELTAGDTESANRVEKKTLPTLEADAEQIGLLFKHLIANGLKFHAPGSPSKVWLEGQSLGNGFWKIGVRDDGIGFDPKYIPTVLKPFKRLNTKDQYPGNGMGLAYCRQVVFNHGGTLKIISAPGQGTKVEIVLPETQRPQ